jgi:hypothetical protein
MQKNPNYKKINEKELEIKKNVIEKKTTIFFFELWSVYPCVGELKVNSYSSKLAFHFEAQKLNNTREW